MEETYGEDPFMVSRFGLAYVKAIRDAGAVPTLKGYPVNYGDAGHDSFPRYVSEREYRELWLVPWEASKVRAVSATRPRVLRVPVPENQAGAV